jgi:two-component system phosphate regulon response regulator PhoB/two-component system alkaline phosphatase synthesis response regulator PhoP
MAQERRILIIEDHPSTINLLSNLIRREGYEPIAARGGEEGLRLLREGGVDLVLLDLMMDDINGWTVLNTMKTDEALCPIPVIIVTARTEMQEESLISSHDGLFEAYITKPFSVYELFAKIAEILRER